MIRGIILKTPINISMLLFVLLAGCATAPAIQSDNNACVGMVISPPAGLLGETDDAALLKSAIGNSGEGKLCAGKVFVVMKPVTVYRVWDKSKSWSALGGWWSLSYPEASREEYRKQNDICPEWSALDIMSACTLKVGAKIVIGPGQSVATCADKKLLPKSSVNQVYIPNDARVNQVYVDGCESADWPGR